MCGIAGYIGHKVIPKINLEKCLTQLYARGPDDRGIYKYNDGGLNVGLLHSRLSILDLDNRSAQPFYFQKYVFSYNGEIYNYLELREELEALGHKFQTNGDTEVLAVAWAKWGKEALNRFDGMWALAVFDTSSNTLTLSTDPFGEKPLFYMRGTDGTVWFGSQIDCLMTLADEKPRPNWRHLKRYLVNGYKSLYKYEDSFVEGVVRLPGNRVMEISISGISERPYWKRPSYTPDFTIKRDDFVAEARATLIDSVSRRLRSDVPLAFCMSGGIDSNSIIAIAAAHLGFDVHGFTIMNNDGRYDEQELVELSSRELNVRNEKIILRQEDFLPVLQSMIKARHGPVATISYYTQNHLYRAISDKGYKVALSGTGADEMFSGYYDHHLLYLSSKFEDSMQYSQALQNWKHFVEPVIRNPLLKDPEMYLETPSARAHVYYKNNYYAEFFLDSWHEPFVETFYCGSLMRNRMMNELFHEAVPVILAEDDHNAMMYSIENRSPFLSRDLLELCLKIPDRELIKNGFAKSILREAMVGLVPKRILEERRKVGFNSSLFELVDIHSNNFREMLLDNSIFYDVIDRARVEMFLRQDLSLNSDSKFLFNLINAKMAIDIME